MAADYSRIHRLLRILTLIQSEATWTVPRLALECNTSQRTLFRDLKMLQAAGIPVQYDPDRHVYEVRRDFFMQPVEMTFEESLAMVALAKHVGGQEQIPFMAAAAKAIAKIRSQLPHQIREQLDQLDEHLAIQLPQTGTSEDCTDVYGRVQWAIANRRALRCVYESVSERARKDEKFLFKPYALFFSQRAWYAIGHHEARGEVRSLKLKRFTRCEQTDQPYLIPADFSVREYLGNAWRMIRGKKTYNLELHFDAAFADTVADTNWHPTQDIEWQEDGSILFRCKVDGLDEVVWWVLSMGPHCTVRQPPELAERIKSLAGEVLARYR